MEVNASEYLIQLCDDHAHSLGRTSGFRNDIFYSPTAILLQISRWAIHSLLGGSDARNCGCECFYNAVVVMDALGQGGLNRYW